MSKKIKCAFITFALASVVTLSAALSACSIKTDHPQAKITIKFNDVTYNIDYTLYRNMYPQTVQHFIELADEGFYNNMIVHDYKSGSDWFTGSYKYNGENDSLYSPSTFSEYLENNYKEAEYYDLFNSGKLSPSVYKSVSYENDKKTVKPENALPTLIGEFSDNQHIIEKNALSAKFGALKMFYYDKGKSNQQAIVKNWAGQILTQNYKYNCATSIFSMQVGTSSYTASKYCVFGELKNEGARNELEDLIEAIDDYTNEVGSSKFITSNIKTRIDLLDKYAVDEDRDIEVSFAMTSIPIIIESVKITKY